MPEPTNATAPAPKTITVDFRDTPRLAQILNTKIQAMAAQLRDETTPPGDLLRAMAEAQLLIMGALFNVLDREAEKRLVLPPSLRS